MEESVLELEVFDEIKVYEGTAPSAVTFSVPSPYFQPAFTFKMEREGGRVNGKPRGPTVSIDMDFLGALA